MMRTQWRGPGEWPSSYEDVDAMTALGRKLRDEPIDIYWPLTEDELKQFRRAIHAANKGHGVPVARFRKFDAQIFKEINKWLRGGSSAFGKINEPVGSENVDSAVRIEKLADGSFRLVGHASFAVIFGWGWSAWMCRYSEDGKQRKIGKVLTEELASKIQHAVEQLGWEMEPMCQIRMQPAVWAIFDYHD